MAQTEDTELRDLVIEALEKNGSLAKIRALLRANIFLAFEDECENMRHNVSLDNVLKVPEGIYALSVVHEFLEFCNLKNTLFVYKSESRQGKDYKYDGKKFLLEKFNVSKLENSKEPVLITLIKNSLKSNYHNNLNEDSILDKREDCGDNIYKDEQNSSYIVHEDTQSSATSSSQSDNSLDEKNKLHLRLQLDNSDTDTSTDSSRDKSASEYIPSEHILETQNNHNTLKDKITKNIPSKSIQKQELCLPSYFSKVACNSSSDSTSYVELKPFSSMDEKMLNTSGLPDTEINDQPHSQVSNKQSEHSKTDSVKSATLNSVSSLSIKNEDFIDVAKTPRQPIKSDGEAAEYSYDFSPSPGSRNNKSDKIKSIDSLKDLVNDANKSSPIASPHQNSQSSVSISDIADLLSDKSFSLDHQTSNEKSPEDKSKISTSNNSKNKLRSQQNKFNSDDSGDFTESPVPSLSNLSLDIHSD